MNKAYITILLALLLLPIASAAAINPDNYGFYGQNQYYYVVYDAEGEAATVARIELQNTQNLTNFSFQIPETNVNLINIVQEYYDYEEQCSNWQQVSCTTKENIETCNQQCTDTIRSPIYPPKYAQVAYSVGESGGKTNVQVNIPEKDQDNIYLIAYYKSSQGVSKNVFGVYNYDFKTIQDAYDTNSVRVSFDVAEDLYMQGVSSAIDYQKQVFSARGADLSALASSVGYIDTGYTKTASSLDPNESFEVKGQYAKSWWNVHWWEVLIGVLFACAAIAAGVYGIRKFTKKNKKMGLPLLLGLASGILLFGLWFVSFYLLNSSYGGIVYNQTLFFFILLLTVVMSVFFLFVPAIYIGYTEGVKFGLICFIATVLTLFVLGLLAISYFMTFSASTNPGPIIY